jgi:hypothetical protein
VIKDVKYLYFDIDSECVYRKPTDHYESFLPTIDLTEGWLVFVEYTVYDSNGPSPGTYYEVIDLYPDAESARAQAIRIKERQWGDIGPEPVKADGSKVYESWKNWGQSFSKCVMVKVTVTDKKPILREEFR